MEMRGPVRFDVSRIHDLVRTGRYGVAGFAHGVVLVQRAVPGDAAALAGWQGFLAECYPRIAARGREPAPAPAPPR
jgi:hypothetical protein